MIQSFGSPGAEKRLRRPEHEDGTAHVSRDAVARGPENVEIVDCH